MSISKRIFMAGCLTICLFLVSAFQIQQPNYDEGMQVDEAGLLPLAMKRGTAVWDDSTGALKDCTGEPDDCVIIALLRFPSFAISTGGVAFIE